MSLRLNRSEMIGHVTRDPETRKAGQNNVSVFRLACNRSYKKGDEWVEKPTFVDCEAWGKLADKVAESVSKGTEVFVSGRLESDEWTAKDSGEKRSKLKIYVLELQVVKGKKEDSNNGDSEESAELPF